MKCNRKTRWTALVLAVLITISCVSAVGFAETGSFEQNFNSHTNGVTPADFTYVKRPADNSTEYTPYTPNDSEDGALLSNKDSSQKAKVEFGTSFTGQITLEADFRLEGQAYTSSSGQIKLLDGFSSTNKNIFMLTSGSCYGDGYLIRPVYVNEAGVLQTTNLEVNEERLAYQTWHHLKIVITTDTEDVPGTLTFYVNDVKIAEGYSRAAQNADDLNGYLDDFSYFTSYSNGTGAYPFLIDNVKVTAVSGVLSDKTDVTSSVYVIDGTAIKGVEAETDAEDVKANLTPAAGATAELYSAYDEAAGTGTVRTGAVQEGDKYVVTAQNGTAKAVYTITLAEYLLPFEQNFDANLDHVTLNGFHTVVRPEDDAEGPFSAYTPNGSQNGAAQSAMENGKRLRIDFGDNVTGQVVFEGQFRYEEKEAASSQIKFFDFYDKNGNCLLMFTIGNSSNDGFTVRPVHKKADGTGVTSPMGQQLAYKAWHTLKVEFDTEFGSMKVFVDGEELVQEGYPWGNIAKVENIAYVESYHSASGHTVPFLIDSVKMYQNPAETDRDKDATASSTVYTVGEDVISAIPSETTAAQVLENISIRAGASAVIYSDYDAKTVREGAVETGDVLEVTSADGTVKKQYTLQLLVISNEYYVAPDGSDTADGSEEHPFATLNQAKNAARAAKNNGQPITVYFKAGTYPMTDTVVFDAGDSGTAEAPITYKAYGDGKVVFKGSKSVDPSEVTAVTDQSVLNRVISETAKSKLMQIDLKAAGITDIPTIPDTYGYAYRGYQPLEVYVNGSALKEARWPNGDSFLPVIDTDGKTNGFMLQYEDETDRASLWDESIEQGEVYIAGSPGYSYAVQHIRLASIDTENRKVVSKGSTNYAPSTRYGKFYFTNLLEEIDLPGESYLDRESGILYFYPNCDISTAEIEVSDFNKTAISMNGTSYVNFEDLVFTYTRGNILNASNVSHITVDGCELSHTSSNAVTLNGTDCIIQNCHIYDLGGAGATGGIHLSGGDRKTLTSSGNKILNNRMHLGDRVYQVGQAPLIRATGVGHVIENNEIYDGTAYVAQFLEANNIQFNYNEVYDSARMSSDVGAVTWGRDTTLLGFELKYNYFHNMGNPHGGVGQQSIFYDDGATGPYAYGNIFYRGALTADEIPSGSNNYSAVKTNGGRYGVFENNIFVESYGAVYFQPWNSPANRWWKYVNDVYTSNANMFQKMTNVDFFGDTWKTYYEDTQWAPLWDHFDEESHAQALALYQNGQTEELDALAAQKENNASNEFNNNVVVNVTIPQNSDEGFTGNGVGTNTYRADSDKLDNGNSIFTEYGKDFSLTPEGLLEVKKVIPNFENIPTEQIGLQPYQRGDQTLYVGGRAPVVSNLALSGSTKPGGTLTVQYSYSDPDEDKEGISEILWYYSDSADGTYERVQDALGKEILITDEMAGGYLKCAVVPYDRNMIHGEELWSDPVQIAMEGSVDKDALRNGIAEAKQFLELATIGDQEGEYPQTAADELNEAIQAAEDILNQVNANQTVVNRAVSELTAALNQFKLSVNESQTAEYMTINEMLEDSQQWYFATPTGGTLEDSQLTLTSDYASYLGGEYQNKVFSFQLNVSEETSWAGIYFRQADGQSLPWGGNSGFMVVFKPDVIEMQTRSGGSPTMTTYEEVLLPFGETADVTVGAYDLNSTDVRLVLEINGELVFSETQTNSPLAGEKGVFGAYVNGGSMTLSPAQVDKSALQNALSQATAFVETAVAGNGYGQYQESALSALENEITAAQAVYSSDASAQNSVDRAVLSLELKLSECQNTIGTSKTFTESESVPVLYEVGDLSFTVNDGVSAAVVMDTSKALPGITATSSGAAMTISEGTTVTKSGWDGSFALPNKTTSPSVSLSSGIEFALSLGEEGVTTDHPIRIVISEKGGRVAAYAGDGKWNVIRNRMDTDSEEAFWELLPSGGTARTVVNGDLVIWTTQPSDLAIYLETGVNPSPSASPTSQPTLPPVAQGGNFVSTGVSTGINQTATCNFIDISDHWAREDIIEMYQKGIVAGITETTFEPDRQITRAEFATLLARGLGLSTGVSAGFLDVEPGLWYTQYINAACSAGLICGYEGYFRPDDNITREEMAVMIEKTYSFLGKEKATGAIVRFSDAAEISEWAYESVDVAATAGLISGNPDGTFCPKNNATRAECTSLVKRILELN